MDDIWCTLMLTNYVFAVLPASALWFSSSYRCTCASVTLRPNYSHFCWMFYCHSSYNSIRVIFEDETGTNTKESKVHALLRHAKCSHANSICGVCEWVKEKCREGEESLAWQKTPPSPLYSLLQPLEVIVCYRSSLKPVVIPVCARRRHCAGLHVCLFIDYSVRVSNRDFSAVLLSLWPCLPNSIFLPLATFMHTKVHSGPFFFWHAFCFHTALLYLCVFTQCDTTFHWSFPLITNFTSVFHVFPPFSTYVSRQRFLLESILFALIPFDELFWVFFLSNRYERHRSCLIWM